MKRLFLILLILLPVFSVLPAQEILTAEQFLDTVSVKYGQITDYEATISIATGKTVMDGTVFFKSPSYLRIDFTQPSGQVVCFNGQALVVYLPEFRSILSQEVVAGTNTGPAGVGMASGEGLKLLKKNYTVVYESSPTPVPLEEGSAEKVIKLSLGRKTVSEGFRNIKISINPDTLFIKRIEGSTISGITITFTFSNIKTNQNIPIARFNYDLPAGANIFNDFLFKTED